MTTHTLSKDHLHGWSTGRGREASAVSWLQEQRRTLQNWMERRRLYKDTLRELSGLNDRELDDIGIVRADIRKIARNSVATSQR